jgi:hypothetical protein
MSAMAAAFAESGHGILTGMSTRPRSQAGDPMTLGNMRADGVRSLDVSCWQFHHRTILSADPWSDHVRCGSSRRPLFKHSAGLVTWLQSCQRGLPWSRQLTAAFVPSAGKHSETQFDTWSAGTVVDWNHYKGGHHEKLNPSDCHATTSVAASRKRPASPENAFDGSAPAPSISGPGSRRCRAAGRPALRVGADLSNAAGAHRCWLPAWRRRGHHGATDRSMALGAARSAVHHRKSARCRQ